MTRRRGSASREHSRQRNARAQRLDALVLLDGATDPDADRSVLREFLQQRADAASVPVKAALQDSLERSAK